MSGLELSRGVSDQRLRGLISSSGTTEKPPDRPFVLAARRTFHQPGPTSEGPAISPAHLFCCLFNRYHSP